MSLEQGFSTNLQRKTGIFKELFGNIYYFSFSGKYDNLRTTVRRIFYGVVETLFGLRTTAFAI